ncbi:MAG: ATP-binding cassette domain-containing protein [Hallerella porci]|uniref:UvrABC system protein A n=1 Tax=Hallerella porci TaxID=1945871 RepID=A0ABX5LS91_9BACT|nr:MULTISPECIES: ATP-binding cassette domain-containing protein [Hallerella]MCI5600896.1 ATP-binding cassette domain-containing protein [Hallerella sp.]MDY3922234.1 ATP-binding cassette domain-containing protein [Hallerella porci]PWL04148.1 excinuclease ABC subunit A [Hallerella porci]
MDSEISLRGAHLRNLKKLNADFPVGKITVVCGPSGCGKSSLVMDVLHGESRRRYLETLSPFALKILGGRTNIPLDSADGLRPSIAISASRGDAPAKSSPLSISECEFPLRILWAALANPACPICGKPMTCDTRENIIVKICELPLGSRLQFLAAVEVKNLSLDAISATLLSQGYSRVIADGKSYSLDALRAEEKLLVPQEIFVVLDRVIIREGVRTRIAEAVDATLRFSHTKVILDLGSERKIFSTIPFCAEHDTTAAALNPADLSPHSLHFQCKTCGGNGEIESKTEDKDAEICPDCGGFRLQNFILESSVQGISWRKILSSSFAELEKILPEIFNGILPEHLKSTAEMLFARIHAVNKIGLGYLGAGRIGSSLSGGELGRLRLSPLATGHLDGMCICLDEPASGLFKTDVEKLWKIFEEIRDRGNTLVLIEHNPFLIERADKVIEMGPGAGELGGEILFSGTPAELQANENSPTGKWLRELAKNPPQKSDEKSDSCIHVKKFHLYDMAPVSAEFPLQKFSVISGESGSGKSTLLFQHILPRFYKGDFKKLGIQNISLLSSRGFFRNRRSTVASAIGIAPLFRDLFSKLPESKIKGFSASKFSTAVPGGRCETCKGEGILRDPSGFEESECPVCLGKRFRDEILEVRFKTLSYADVLDLTVEKAATIFNFASKFTEKLLPLVRTGLGYLRLGQSTANLSGGEAARIKLSLALSRAKFPNTLFLFDEPARGLHKNDIDKMIALIRELVENGHTVIAIEHQEDFLRNADYKIELKRKNH